MWFFGGPYDMLLKTSLENLQKLSHATPKHLRLCFRALAVRRLHEALASGVMRF